MYTDGAGAKKPFGLVAAEMPTPSCLRDDSKLHCLALDPRARFLSGIGQSPGGNDVYRAPEEVLQVALERSLLEQAPSLAHVDEQVQVTP